jgi:hypothetical protein
VGGSGTSGGPENAFSVFGLVPSGRNRAGTAPGSGDPTPFALVAGDSTPQGITAPPPLDPMTGAALMGASSVGPFAVAGLPYADGRDTAFALPGQDQLPGGPAYDLPAGSALAPHLDRLTSFAAAAWTSGGAAGGRGPLDPLPPLTPGGGQGVGSERGAAFLLDDAWAGDGAAFAAATDYFFATLANEAPPAA